jgi:hypothetical protein
VFPGLRELSHEEYLQATNQVEPKKEPVQGGRKDDGEKVRTDLYSIPAYLGTCRVLTFGAKKYAAWNWSKGILYMRIYGAILRHLFAWVTGEDNDPETGLPHLDHAACELMFLQHFTKDGKYRQYDDRPYGKLA